jgi:hypothetical protein
VGSKGCAEMHIPSRWPSGQPCMGGQTVPCPDNDVQAASTQASEQVVLLNLEECNEV